MASVTASSRTVWAGFQRVHSSLPGSVHAFRVWIHFTTCPISSILTDLVSIHWETSDYFCLVRPSVSETTHWCSLESLGSLSHGSHCLQLLSESSTCCLQALEGTTPRHHPNKTFNLKLSPQETRVVLSLLIPSEAFQLWASGDS